MEAGSQVGGMKLLGGRLCLDFANSVGGRAPAPADKRSRGDDYVVRDDKLESYADLVAWGKHTGLLADKEARHLLRLAESNPSEARKVHARGVALREAIYRIFTPVIDGRKPGAADVDTLNNEAARARDHERLIHTPEGFTWGWEEDELTLDRVLLSVAKSAAEVLTSEDVVRVRRCGGDACGWLFLDTSRNRSRQWCDMRDCGNLAKVRRFRERQSAGH